MKDKFFILVTFVLVVLFLGRVVENIYYSKSQRVPDRQAIGAGAVSESQCPDIKRLQDIGLQPQEARYYEIGE